MLSQVYRFFLPRDAL